MGVARGCAAAPRRRAVRRGHAVRDRPPGRDDARRELLGADAGGGLLPDRRDADRPAPTGWPEPRSPRPFDRIPSAARAPAVGRGARRVSRLAGGRRAVAAPLPGDGRRRDGQRVPGHRLPAAAGRGPRPGRRGVQLPGAAGVRAGRARVPAGGRGPVRAGARPRPAARRRAGRARRRRAPARPDDVPRAGRAPDGGAAVGRGATAPARRPGRPGRRRLVRGAPRPRRPGRPGGGGAQRPGEGRVRRPAAGALPARPGRRRRGASRSAVPAGRRFFPEIPDELLVAARGRRGAPRR